MTPAVPMGDVEVIRAYEDPGRRPGEHRVLIDRLWPRGVQKATRDVEHSGAAVLRHALITGRGK